MFELGVNMMNIIIQAYLHLHHIQMAVHLAKSQLNNVHSGTLVFEHVGYFAVGLETV